MSTRISLSLKHFSYKRAAFQHYLMHQTQVDALVNVRLEDLRRHGIEVLVLDFDGVLAPYGEMCPSPELEHWLQTLARVLPIYILSNKPLAARDDYFRAQHPSLRFIKALPKPQPEGLLRIVAESGLPASSHLMVDDRLATGVLAAYLAGTRALYIRKPLTNYTQHFWAEGFFSSLRLLERCCFRSAMVKMASFLQ